MPVDAGSIYSEIRILIDKLKGDIQQVDAQFDKISVYSQQTSTKTQKSWDTGFKNISLAGIAAFATISIAIKKAIGVFGNFEQSLANVQSVARATPAEFARLEEAAIAAGESTRFTASQAADALYYLASAGLDAEKSINALQGVLELAGATQSDLAFTSATMAAALSQFGLEATQSTRVANVFTAAIQRSQANMDKLATSLKYVGPVAAGFGMSIEQTVGILEGLYNAGYQGEQAGAALRNVFADLSDETGPVVKRLQELGYAFEEISPTTNDFATIIDNLNSKGIQIEETMAAFGNRAGPIMATLLKQGGDSIRKFTADITDTNSAAEAYAIQNDTLKGSLDFFRSAAESTAIQLTKEFAPVLRFLVDVGTNVLKFFNSLPGPLKVLIAGMAIGIPVVAGLTLAFSALAGVFAAVSAPVLIVVGAISALVAGITALTNIQSKSVVLQKDLRKSTENLNKSIGEYEENQKQLKKAIADGNTVEAETLKIRQELLKNQIALNLKDTVKNIEALTKEETKQNKELDKRNKVLNDAKKVTSDYNNLIKELIMLNDRGSDQLLFYQSRVKDVTAEMGRANDAVNKQKLAINQSTLAREEAVAILAQQLNAGQIELVQISALNKEVANLVLEKSKQIKEQEKLNKYNETGNQLDKDATEELDRRTEAEKKLTEQSKKYREQLEEIGKSDIELLEIERKRAIEDAKNSEANQKTIDETITAINKLYNAKIKKIKSDEDEAKEQENLKKQQEELNKISEKGIENSKKIKELAEERRRVVTEANEQAAATEKDYNQKLEDLNKTALESIEISRQRAIETINNSMATEDAQNRAILAINEYYDALRDNTANEEFQQNMRSLWENVLSTVSSVSGSIQEIFASITDARIAELEKQLQAELKAAGVSEETTIERLRKELKEAQASGDQQLIQEKEIALKREEITLEFEKKKADIQYRAKLAEWKWSWLQIISDSALAITKAIASAPWPFNSPAILAATIGTTAQITRAATSKPEPPSFQTGGIVFPSNTSEGITAKVAENDSSELMLNNSEAGRPFLNQFADLIAKRLSSIGINFTANIYTQDDKLTAQETVRLINNGVFQIDPRGIKK